MGYLKKKVKDERGAWIAVYARSQEELDEKVEARLTQIEAAKVLASQPMCTRLPPIGTPRPHSAASSAGRITAMPSTGTFAP